MNFKYQNDLSYASNICKIMGYDDYWMGKWIQLL